MTIIADKLMYEEMLSPGIKKIGHAQITLSSDDTESIRVDRVYVPEELRRQGEAVNALTALAIAANELGKVMSASVFPDSDDPTVLNGLRRAFNKAGFMPLEMDGETYFNEVEFYPWRITSECLPKESKNGSAVHVDQQYCDIEAHYWHKAGSPKAGAMLAPNGKPSKLSKEQWIQVRTAPFKDWFGDWQNSQSSASKVIDENGEPLLIRHGTCRTKFERFDEKEIGTATDSGIYGEGFYFTNSEAEALKYGENVISAYMLCMRPFVVGKADSVQSAMRSQGLFDSIGDLPLNLFNQKTANSSQVTKILQEHGFDGVLKQDFYGNHEFVAFDVRQIRFASEYSNAQQLDAEDNNFRPGM